MSAGAAILLDDAMVTVAHLRTAWPMPEASCPLVGSVRRHRHRVRDIEFIAPLPMGDEDPLLDAIISTRVGVENEPPLNLFAPRRVAPTRFVTEASGLKPGFKLASLIVEHPDRDPIAVQIYRYTPNNRGWVELMRTGPSAFGQMVLVRWKRKWGIHADAAGSVDGHLVDANQNPVSVPSELTVFSMIDMAFVEPVDRDAYVTSTVGKW